MPGRTPNKSKPNQFKAWVQEIVNVLIMVKLIQNAYLDKNMKKNKWIDMSILLFHWLRFWPWWYFLRFLAVSASFPRRMFFTFLSVSSEHCSSNLLNLFSKSSILSFSCLKLFLHCLVSCSIKPIEGQVSACDNIWERILCFSGFLYCFWISSKALSANLL